MELNYRGMNFEDDPMNFDEQSKENWKEWIYNRKRTFILFSAVALLIALVCIIVLSMTVLKSEYIDEIGNQNNLSRIKREKMLKYLHQISGTNSYISGVYNPKLTYDTLQNSSKITKAFPGVVSTIIPRHDASSTEWKTFIENVIFLWNKHHLVEIVWWDYNPFRNMDIFTFTKGNFADREEKWNELMLEGSVLNDIWKEQLDLIAPHLQKLQTAGVVPVMDILPKINGKYTYLIWSGYPGVNGSLKLYKMTQDYLKQKHNFISVLWAWSVDPTVGMSNIGEYWPGGDYVDVVSVCMTWRGQLTMNNYQKLVNLAGNKPMSMEMMFYVPTTQLLAAQRRWTWFTASYNFLDDERRNSVSNVRATFNSISVIRAENITYFNITN